MGILYFPSIQCGAGGARDHRPRGRNPPLAASLSPLGPRNRLGAWCARVVPCTTVLDPCATVDSLIGTSPSCRKTARGSAGILSSTLAKKTRERDNTPYVDRFVFPESFGVDHDTLVVEEHEAKSVSTKKELAVVKVDGVGGRQVRRIAHAPASVSYRSLLLIGATR